MNRMEKKTSSPPTANLKATAFTFARNYRNKNDKTMQKLHLNNNFFLAVVCGWWFLNYIAIAKLLGHSF